MIVQTLDLFCGAGGSSLGVHLAWAGICLGLDKLPRAIETYVSNFPGSGRDFEMTPQAKVSELGLKQEDIHLLMASPECTNHACGKGSAARDEESKKAANYELKFPRNLQHRWIIIESVVQMKQWDDYEPLNDGLRNLEGCPYGVTVQALDDLGFGKLSDLFPCRIG